MTCWRALLNSVTLACLLLWSLPVAANDEVFVVETAHASQRDEVYFLTAVFDLNLPEYIVSSVEQGFELPLVVEIEVFRKRSFWFDKREQYIRFDYRINYRSMLDSVSVFHVNSGQRKEYPSLKEALDSLTIIFDQPMLDARILDNDEAYRGRIRIGIAQDYIPLPLKSSSVWENDWTLASDWEPWDIER